MPFSPSERQIYEFQYREGGRAVDRAIDPFEVLERMTDILEGKNPLDVWATMRKAYAPPDDWPEGEAYEPDGLTLAESREAERKLVPATLEAFGLAPYDGASATGLTRAESLELFVDWYAWLIDLKKAPEPTPSGANSSGSRAH